MDSKEFRKLKSGDTIRVEEGPNKGKIYVLEKDNWWKLSMMSFSTQQSWSTIIIGEESYDAENCSVIRKGV